MTLFIFFAVNRFFQISTHIVPTTKLFLCVMDKIIQSVIYWGDINTPTKTCHMKWDLSFKSWSQEITNLPLFWGLKSGSKVNVNPQWVQYTSASRFLISHHYVLDQVPFIYFYLTISPSLVTCQLAPTSQLFTIMLYKAKTPKYHMWAFPKLYPQSRKYTIECDVIICCRTAIMESRSISYEKNAKLQKRGMGPKINSAQELYWQIVLVPAGK